MKTITLRAHFDGQSIRLDEPFRLEPDTPLAVTVLPKTSDPDLGWYSLSASGLEAAYCDEEPEYPLNLIIEPNPDYEGG
ncbi:MAG TPA: hypothetical protein VKK31_18080 [Thermoanaerobaculia bacterium]|nr:hypothetical protein [Thermoanaerobaculia bacterium]